MVQVTFGSFVVNTYSGGTGHVDITLFTGANGQGQAFTYGLNVHGFPNGQGATQGGWYREDAVLSSAKSNGTLQYQSPPVNVTYNTLTFAKSKLDQQVGTNGQLGSPGYWLWGDNCVDGVSQALGFLGVNNNTAQYMKPSMLPVYAYAQAVNTSVRIPTPAGAVNVETNPYKVVVGSGARLLEYAAQTGANVVSWFTSLVGAQSQSPDGTPAQFTTGQIVIQLSNNSNIATITYDTSQMLVYDLSGNYVSTGGQFGLPSDLVNSVLQDLNSLQLDYPPG